jgi:hypothetical protein
MKHFEVVVRTIKVDLVEVEAHDEEEARQAIDALDYTWIRTEERIISEIISIEEVNKYE